MDPRLRAALRLVACAGRGMTERGCALVSAHAPALLAAGLVRYAPDRWAGYAVTAAGRDALARLPDQE